MKKIYIFICTMAFMATGMLAMNVKSDATAKAHPPGYSITHVDHIYMFTIVERCDPFFVQENQPFIYIMEIGQAVTPKTINLTSLTKRWRNKDSLGEPYLYKLQYLCDRETGNQFDVLRC